MTTLQSAVKILSQGGVIAYPTEAVYGLGCDPRNEKALKRLLQIKNRAAQKGLILIAANWQQLQAWVAPIAESRLNEILATWPGPITWLFPAAKNVSPLVRGEHDTIAVRITAHPLVQQLCQLYGGALISTSANLSAEPPARNAAEVQKIFGSKIDIIVEGALGDLQNPTPIYDAITGTKLR